MRLVTWRALSISPHLRAHLAVCLQRAAQQLQRVERDGVFVGQQRGAQRQQILEAGTDG